ncbi:restriction endonuclease subunit S, partial [Lactobacillus gasseri]
MEDIKIKLLGEICEFYSGTGFPKKFQGNLEGKYPFYKVGDISKSADENKNFLTKSDNYVDERIVKTLKGKIVPPKTIVFAKIGEALKLNRRMITSTECLIDNNVLGIKPKNDSILAEYIFYFMKFVKLENYSESTTVPSVRKSELEKIKIRVPSIQNQQKIISILENIDKTKKSKTESLKKLNELIKARFVEMFGDPEIKNKDKSLKKLCDICLVNPDKRKDPRLTNNDLEVSFVPMSAVSENGDIDTTNIKLYSEVRKGFTYFSSNDVLFAKITPCMENGKGAIAQNLKNDIGFGSTEFHVLRPLENLSNPYWLYVLTTFDSFRKVAEINMTGSAGQKRVPVKFLENYKVNIPPLSLQNEFANFVQQVDKSK